MAKNFQRISIVAMLAFLCPLGAILNLIVMVAIIKNKRLHSTTYVLYFHLALCDALVSIIGGAMGIPVYVTGQFIYCQTMSALISLTYAVSIGTVTLLSIDRFVYLQMPMLYLQRMTKRRICIGLFGLWAVGAMNVILPLTVGLMFQKDESVIGFLNRKNCVLARIWRREYTLWTCLVFICFPTTLIAILNFKIFRLASDHHNNIQLAHLSQIKDKVTSSGKQSIVDKLQTRTKKRKKSTCTNKRAIRTTTYIVITNVVCTMPYIFVLIIEASCQHCIEYRQIRYTYTLFLLNFMTSILNPLINTFTNTEFRKIIRKEVLCCSPSSSPTSSASSICSVSVRNSTVESSHKTSN